jgi:formylglycine-generating enzyme required for sulfatase activity
MKNSIIYLIFYFVFFIAFLSVVFLYRTIEIETHELALLTEKKDTHPLDIILDMHRNVIYRNPFFKQSLREPQTDYSIQNKYIHQCEVTQNEFNLFVNLANAKETNSEQSSATFNHRVSGQLNAPVTGVDFMQAERYCQSRQGRLPSNREWEAAANTLNGNIYPWGNSFINDDSPYLDPILNTTKHCGKISTTANENKIFDMSGNVSEWVTSDKGALIKGANGFDQDKMLASLNFATRKLDPKTKNARVGFRCIFDKPIRGEKIIKMADGDYKIGVPNQSYYSIFASLLSGNENKSFLHKGKEINFGHSLHVGIYEVTVAQYKRFLQDPLVNLNVYAIENQPKKHSYIPLNWNNQLSTLSKPVTGVDWWSAYAFSAWGGGRLPSQDEWSYIYLTTTPQPFEYNNHYYLDSVSITCPLPNSNICGLSGNVSEWTSSIVFSSDGSAEAIYKGGNYKLPYEQTNDPEYMQSVSPYYRSDTLGFRFIR